MCSDEQRYWWAILISVVFVSKKTNSNDVKKSSFLEAIKKELVLVEGEKDQVALERLGFERIIKINRGKALFAIADELAGKCGSVVVLSDFDRKGKEICAQLTKMLEQRHVKVNKKARILLKKIFEKACVESWKEQ